MIKELYPEFEKPSIAIDTVFLRTVRVPSHDNRKEDTYKLQILCAKDREDESGWVLPGGIMRIGEVANDVFLRKFRVVNDEKKEVDMENIHMEQLYTIVNNPYRDQRGHVVAVVYIGIIRSGFDIIPTDGNRYQFEWFDFNETFLSSTTPDSGCKKLQLSDKDSTVGSLKYDHADIIMDSVERVRNKLMYTDTGFYFAPEKFTINQAEEIFTAINGKEIKNFRGNIICKIQDTNEYEQKNVDKKAAHRPAKLFKKI